ncbi:flagellar brake protein [Thermotalea metallivorans]|uniref:Flagellar brake protein YcgR n=1 Tax=Thermotalea metallivorans TaxID=520762 RepID=A0A140L5E3_9FIRM|nr:PilZ domain-containing protein [Thermotalea metallivorans]KXG75768.1 hypothetical protein AN619_15220 [Thermotalea metallivorans]
MSSYDLPKVGDRIEIENTPISKRGSALISQVLDKVDEQVMFIAMPIINNVMVPIPVGEIIRIKYAQKNVGIFVFRARVVSRKHSEQLAYMKIERISDVEKVQRRDYYRLEVVLDVQMKIIKPGDADHEKIIHGLSKDISGGGLRVIAKTKLSANDVADIIIKTGENPIRARGRIIRCASYDGSRDEYDVAIMFENISESVRTQIISFIFGYQRKMKKKGLV